MSRPSTLVVVVGTGTEIGKTWLSAAVSRALRASGCSIAARKPAQSFDPAEAAPTDAEVLCAATGERVDDVCPPHRSYPVAMAPPMATDVLGLPTPTISELADEIIWPHETVDIGLVETVGGVRSPVASDGDSLALARLLEPDVTVLVADAGLGTIDSVRLATDALQLLPTVVFLNRFDPDDDLHRRNHQWLEDRDGLDLCTEVEALVERLRG